MEVARGVARWCLSMVVALRWRRCGRVVVFGIGGARGELLAR
jgi:hypothetical protein